MLTGNPNTGKEQDKNAFRTHDRIHPWTAGILRVHGLAGLNFPFSVGCQLKASFKLPDSGHNFIGSVAVYVSVMLP